MFNQRFLKCFDMRAAIIFIAAHFLSMSAYHLIVIDGAFTIWQGGFALHMCQALIYLTIVFINIDIKLRIASFVTFIMYGLIGINWLLFQRGIEIEMQTYFYNNFEGIITTLNLIVIYLLGKDGAIYLFNMFLIRFNFLNKLQLFYRNVSHSRICNINLFFSSKNIKNKEVSK